MASLPVATASSDAADLYKFLLEKYLVEKYFINFDENCPQESENLNLTKCCLDHSTESVSSKRKKLLLNIIIHFLEDKKVQFFCTFEIGNLSYNW